MVDYKELRKILNNSGMSIRKPERKGTRILDSSVFRGAKLSAVEEAKELLSDAVYEDTKAAAAKSGVILDSVKTAHERALNNTGKVIEALKIGKNVDAHNLHNIMAVRDNIVNPRLSVSTGADPLMAATAFPNIYISPYEAASLYSQKGIFENVINKKSKTILLNGVRIENPYLSVAEVEKVNERISVLQIQKHIADSVRDSLCYGGALVFPVFKKDTPATTQLKLSTLVKLGVLKKDCIDFFITLDRWNTFIIPPYNPTQKDFYRPEVYTVPFMGSDVHHSRCARVVTAEQAGYWGQVINQGWGISDFCGYLQSGLNYKVAVQSLPLMIQQMSILARTVNVDGVLATEGTNALDALIEENTIKTREASTDNPVTLEVLGELKSIDRNFSEVPALIRLLRQDFASDAILPEQMLFSSEKGNFSSGDDTEGNLTKQWEAVRMIHKNVECQYLQVAKVMVIDALGVDEHIMKSLPYTKLRFDEPVIANALDKAQIGKLYAENIFNLVSARIPIDIAVEMASKNMSKDMEVSVDVLNKLKEIQKTTEERDKERFEMEMETQEANIENSNAAAKEAKAESKIKAMENKEEEKGYTRLEQKQKEQTRLGETKRSEKKAKFEKALTNKMKQGEGK